MLLLLTAHLALAVAAPAVMGLLGRRGFLVLAAGPAAAAVWALRHTSAVLDGRGPEQIVEWVPALGMELTFRLDTLSWLMVVIVGGVGALVLVYCSAYFSATAAGLGRFAGVFVAFSGAMLGLVVADDLLMLYVFWELTTVFSYLLIGHYSDRKASRRAAMQAIIITTAGGLAMLVGLVILGTATGTYRASEVIAAAPSGTAITVAIVLLLAGAATKSALIPLHFWLPAAMAAPTPVSAYLHAAAMVKAGVYLVARFAPAFADHPVWRGVVLTLGAGTLLVGGYRAMRQYDLKLILAFGTVSQLGFIVLLVGLGTQGAALAGLALLGAHAMFKASLFLVVGLIDISTGTRDLRRLNGMHTRLPGTAVVAALATASMIGLPPFAGYVAKEAALHALVEGDAGPSWVGIAVLVAVVLGSGLTVGYGLRLWFGAFGRKPWPTATPEEVATRTEVERPSMLLSWPAGVLALLGIVAAMVPQVGERLLVPHAEAYPRGEPGHLTMWSGFGLPLVLTLVAFAIGLALFAQRARVERLQDSTPAVLEADQLYRRFMRRLDGVAADVTGQVQRGSLPFYLGVILLVVVVVPGVALLSGVGLPDDVRLWDHPWQGVIGVVCVLGAVLAARARRRLKAVLLLGVSGYGIALLFLVHGAPDLALTQALVETITLVVFVLVMRRLPAYFSDRPLRTSRWVRLAIGVLTGAAVAAFTLVAPGMRIHEPVSVHFPEEAYSFGGGLNIVNVTLVDIRAWDTMGEISVLLVAATGVASLVFLRRRSGEILRVPAIDDPSRTDDGRRVWEGPVPDRLAAVRERVAKRVSPRDFPLLLPGVRTLAPERRSVIFEVSTRLLFHTMVVLGVYLLFAGHNAPGGGFTAGLITGIALVLRYLAGGRYELGEAAPVHPGLVLGAGLFLSAGAGLIPLLAGGTVLQSVAIDLHVPLLGEIHLVTSLFFDIGVYLVVIGLVLDILRSLGAEIDQHGEQPQDATEDVAAQPTDDPVALGAVGVPTPKDGVR